MNNVTALDFQAMVSHWLATPVNGYLGSDYGNVLPDLLQNPLRAGGADVVLSKLRADVPLAGALPRAALNMYMIDEGPDKRRFYIDVSGKPIEVGGGT
ncbi:hypothetical protein [Paraburkholderia sp. J10-1]|uniref:hypothetical protein n=1 Tax=Paraburkholderia sp. J10-1 TaxID=2805430 RepID=UPI002AB73529|nr:hypothetical protein [Paraburkholderia sp. J10-1]